MSRITNVVLCVCVGVGIGVFFYLTNTSTSADPSAAAAASSSFFFSLIIRRLSSIIFFLASSLALAASDFLAESGVSGPPDPGEDFFVLDEAGLFRLVAPDVGVEAFLGVVLVADLTVGLERLPFNMEDEVF